MSKVNDRKKMEDGITTASSHVGLLHESCWMCGVMHTQEDMQGSVQGVLDTTKHLPWCEQVTRKIYNDFQGTFREIYNVLELSLEGKKLDIAKSLIGNKIMEARNQAIERVIIFNKN